MNERRLEERPENALRSVLERGAEFLTGRGVEPARFLAERLLEGVLSCRRFELYLNRNRRLEPAEVDRFFGCLRKRAEGIPSQYILGQAEFMDFLLEVNPDVLIPRPETEFLVEKVLAETRASGRDRRRLSILDMGTGSGNIAISLASYLPQGHVTAVDISGRALDVARRNALRNEVAHRIEFLAGDLFAKILSGGEFDLIVSNPPYLSESDLAKLPPEVEREPRLALDGGHEGTEWIGRFVGEAHPYLAKGGLLFFEIGAGQAGTAASLLRRAGWRHFEIFKDYNGWDRMVMAWTNS